MPPSSQSNLPRLQQALVNADAAGDTAAATTLAQEIRRQMAAATDVIPAAEMGGPGIITPDEASGMMMPTAAQLQARQDQQSTGEADPLTLATGGAVVSPEVAAKVGQMGVAGGGGSTVPNSGAPLWARAGAGIKMTPAGKASFYQQTLGGSQPVVSGPDGKVYIYDDKTGQYVPANPPGFDPGDIADLSGVALQVAPNIAATGLPGGTTAPGQAAAGAVGSVLRQGASALLPGSDQMTPTERVADVGTNAAMAGVGQGALNVGAKLLRAAKPAGWIGRKYQAALQTPAGQQGSALLARMKARTSPDAGVAVGPKRPGTNFFLTAAEETQDPWLMGVQQNAAASFKGKTAALNTFNLQAKQAFTEANQIVDDMGAAKRLSPAQFGDDVASRFQTAVNRLFNNRRMQADADYAVFKDNPTQVPFRNLMNAVQDAEKNYSALRGSVRKGLRAVSPAIKNGNDMMSISALQDLRKTLSNAAYGKGRLFDRLDPGVDKVIARDFVKAIDADFAAAQDWVGQDLAGALKTANANWRNNTEIVNQMRDTVVGQMLRGKRVPLNGNLSGGGNITEALLNTDPRDVAALLKVTEFDNPIFHAQLRDQFVQKFVQDGIRGAASLPPGAFPFNPRTALAGNQGIGGDREMLKVLFKDPAQRQAYQDLLRFSQRISSPTSSIGLKPTQELTEGAAIAGGAATGHATSVGVFGTRFAAKWYLGNTATKLLYDPEGRQALRVLATGNPQTRAFINAANLVMVRTMLEPSESDTAAQLPPANQNQ